ncbi:MAG TPA: hypothetical protein VFK03_03235 [Candidatus Saccharimonadales bacterium]|nr:hypothetical protein [Candidatus Saccharimonadales bacterium]
MLRRLIDSDKVMGFVLVFLGVVAIVALSYHPASDKAPKSSLEPSVSGTMINPAYDGSKPSHNQPMGTSDPALIPGVSDGPVNRVDPLHGELPKCSDDGPCGTPDFGPEQQPVQDNDPALLSSTAGYAPGSAERYARPPTDNDQLPEWKCYKPSKRGYVVPDGFRPPEPQAVGPGDSLEQFPDWLCKMSEVS